MIVVINTWDQMKAAGGDRVAISYHPAEPRRCEPAKYVVWRLRDGVRIASGPDRVHDKSFLPDYPLREGKPVALGKALAWVKKIFGKDDLVRNRLGDYVERAVNECYPIGVVS